VKLVNQIIQGDAVEVLRQMPDECIDCVVTSPPYYGLRDYGVQGQIGLEETFEAYIDKMLAITTELKRVLKKEGTMWWNHGDCYGGQQGKFAGWPDQKLKLGEKIPRYPKPKQLAKCLLLQPYRLAQRMIDEQGWILRNIIIWHKPNCMPSSVKDRFTVDYEPILFFVKNKKYWFEMQYEEFQSNHYDRARMAKAKTESGGRWAQESGGAIKTQRAFVAGNKQGRNKRCVWRIPTRPFPEAHFAVYPPDLIETPIKAGCPEFICIRCGKARKKSGEEGTTMPSISGCEMSKKKGLNMRIEGRASRRFRITMKRITAVKASGLSATPNATVMLDSNRALY